MTLPSDASYESGGEEAMPKGYRNLEHLDLTTGLPSLEPDPMSSSWSNNDVPLDLFTQLDSHASGSRGTLTANDSEPVLDPLDTINTGDSIPDHTDMQRLPTIDGSHARINSQDLTALENLQCGILQLWTLLSHLTSIVVSMDTTQQMHDQYSLGQPRTDDYDASFNMALPTGGRETNRRKRARGLEPALIDTAGVNRQRSSRRERKHSCGLCTKAFFYPKDLRRHMSNVHKDHQGM